LALFEIATGMYVVVGRELALLHLACIFAEEVTFWKLIAKRMILRAQLIWRKSIHSVDFDGEVIKLVKNYVFARSTLLFVTRNILADVIRTA
jgi:hypothetical protein